MKWKVIKTLIDWDDPMTQLGYPIVMKEPKFVLYYQESYLFGLIKFWTFRMTCNYDPKNYLNVIESNY